MTEAEAQLLIYAYEEQRDPTPHVIGTPSFSTPGASGALLDVDIDETWVSILMALDGYYIQIHNFLDNIDYVMTRDQKILLSKVLLYNNKRWGWDLSNLRKALDDLLNDKEFIVFAVKSEG